ncbi:MAG: hypothetical protein V2A73_06780 [Pseudomonadota bacterium]
MEWVDLLGLATVALVLVAARIAERWAMTRRSGSSAADVDDIAAELTADIAWLERELAQFDDDVTPAMVEVRAALERTLQNRREALALMGCVGEQGKCVRKEEMSGQIMDQVRVLGDTAGLRRLKEARARVLLGERSDWQGEVDRLYRECRRPEA